MGCPMVPGFRALGPSVYVQDGHEATTPTRSVLSQSQTQSPDLIVLTSWTGANPKHIAKYTDGYNALFPGVPVLLITTVIQDLAFRSSAEKQAALAPAVRYINPSAPNETTLGNRAVDAALAATHCTAGRICPPRFTSILLHVFSEGGSNKAVCLARAYRSATAGQFRLPVAAIVLDSTPGCPHFVNNVAAFKRSLPRNRLAHMLGLPLGVAVLALTWLVFYIFVGFDNNAISKTRRALNDSRLWRVGQIPRAYLFSETDDLICWRDVEDHGEESARTHGVTSLMVRFKKSGHCSHARGGQEAYYWNAVAKCWEGRDVERGIGW